LLAGAFFSDYAFAVFLEKLHQKTVTIGAFIFPKNTEKS